MQDELTQKNIPSQKTPAKKSSIATFIKKAKEIIFGIYIFGLVISTPFMGWFTGKDVNLSLWVTSGIVKSIAWPYYAYRSVFNSNDTKTTTTHNKRNITQIDKLNPPMLQESVEILSLSRFEALDKLKAMGFDRIKTNAIGGGVIDMLAFPDTTEENPYIGAFMFSATETKKASAIWYAFHPKYEIIAKNFISKSLATTKISDVTSQEATIYTLGSYTASNQRKFIISIRDEIWEGNEHLYSIVYNPSR